MTNRMLQGKRVRLRAPEPSDIDTFCRGENDTKAWDCGSTLAPMSRRQIERYVENYSADLIGDRQLRLVIEDMADNTALGALDLFDFDPLNSRCGIGIIIDEDARGKGIATEALSLVADYGRRHLGLHQLWCHVACDNNASRRLFAGAGFKMTGCLRQWLRRRDTYVDVEIYQLVL